jgi:16S rRNA (cytosine967-C5)-methyltransferase
MGSKDRGRVAEAVYGVLRKRRLLGAMVGNEHEVESLLAAYLISESGLSGRAVQRLGNGANISALVTKARTLEIDSLPFAVRCSLPDWLAAALVDQFGEAQAAALAQALNSAAPVDLRVNTLKTTREALASALDAAGFPCELTPYSPVGLRRHSRAPLFNTSAFRDGWFEVQDEGSQLVSLLLAPKRRDTVVDFCAGGGGKTLHLGALMENTGSLYALDVHQRRLEKLWSRVKRAGLDNVRCLTLKDESDEEVLRRIGQAQRVLVDAPCSGTGTLRRNPDIKWRDIDLDKLVQMQGRILRAASKLLRPGGRLVYATCSLLRQENEEVVGAFLREHPQFSPVSACGVVSTFAADADALCHDGYLRLLPHRHGTDGFFAAIVERRAASDAAAE